MNECVISGWLREGEKDGLWHFFISSQATGSPGLPRRMNHGLEAWHTPQAEGTSSLKSLRKRPLPSLPAKPECRAKVRHGEEKAKLQQELCQGVRVLQSCCLLFLGSINTLRTPQPIPTFACGLVFPESVRAAEN